jgi:nitroreductase
MLNPNPDVYEAVKGLRVIRRFQDKPVSDEHLTAILEAGRWTGSSKNRQSWVFVVVRDRNQLDELTKCGDFTGPLATADLFIAPVRLPDGYDWDMGRVSQNMMLAAAAVGVGSCPITFHRHDQARAVLGVPDDHGCMWGMAMGYPDEAAETSSRAKSPLSGRKPLEDLVRYDRFA